jgi:hypothetical protein
MLTLDDLADRMKHLDEVTLLEVLDINSSDLVDRFMDKIESRYDYFVEDMHDLSDDQDEGY